MRIRDTRCYATPLRYAHTPLAEISCRLLRYAVISHTIGRCATTPRHATYIYIVTRYLATHYACIDDYEITPLRARRHAVTYFQPLLLFHYAYVISHYVYASS